MIIMNEQIDLHPSIDGRDLLGEDTAQHLYLVIRGRMPMLSFESLLIDMVRRLMDGGLIMPRMDTRDLYMIFVLRPTQVAMAFNRGKLPSAANDNPDYEDFTSVSVFD